MVSAAADTGLPLGRQRVLFVGGKGGVGKSTTASALALRLADEGDRTLLVSTDPAHSLGDLWDRKIGDRITRLASNLSGIEIDPDAEVDSYLNSVKRTMRDLVSRELYPEIERQMSLARQSPGAVEAAMLDRMTALMSEETEFDRVVFDTAPTGHTLRLLSLPEIMAAWTDGLLRQRDRADSWNAAIQRLGPRPGAGEDLNFLDAVEEPEDERSARIRRVLLERRRRFYRARRLLLDPNSTAFILVLNPEKLPILESRKAVDALREFDVPVLGLVVNRVLPHEPLGDFLERRRERESMYLRQIDELFPKMPRVEIPLLPDDVVGIDALRWFGKHLLTQDR